MNDYTLLHRNVHPSWVQDGRVTSQAFQPSAKDQRRLSTYDGDQISAEGSWRHFTAKSFESTGVLSVTVTECISQQLAIKPDPEEFAEHVHVVFDGEGLTRSLIKSKSKFLTAAAISRGWQYRA